MAWTIVKPKQRNTTKTPKHWNTVKKCYISKSLPLHDSLRTNVMETNVLGNQLLKEITNRIDHKTKVGNKFIVTINTDCQYMITIIDHSIILTIINQQYLRRKFDHKIIRFVPMNNRKVIIYWSDTRFV